MSEEEAEDEYGAGRAKAIPAEEVAKKAESLFR